MTIKQKIIDLNLTVKPVFYHFVPLILSFIIFLILFHSKRDTEIIKVFFPTLITIQGSILILALTMAIISIQIIASTYSQHMMAVFKSLKDLWIFVTCYCIYIIGESIILISNFNLFQDNSLPINYLRVLVINCEFYFNAYVWKSCTVPIPNIFDINWGIISIIICSFLSLCYFSRRILEILTPENAISHFWNSISKNFRNNTDYKTRGDNGLQDISSYFSISFGAIKNFDILTIKLSLKNINEKLPPSFNVEHGGNDFIFIASKQIVDEISSLSKEAISKNFCRASEECILTLILLKNKPNTYFSSIDGLIQIIRCIGNIAYYATEKKNSSYVTSSLENLYFPEFDAYFTDNTNLFSFDPKIIEEYIVQLENIGIQSIILDIDSITYLIRQKVIDIRDKNQNLKKIVTLEAKILTTFYNLGNSALNNGKYEFLSYIISDLEKPIHEGVADPIVLNIIYLSFINLSEKSIDIKIDTIAADCLNIVDDLEKAVPSSFTPQFWDRIYHITQEATKNRFSKSITMSSHVMGNYLLNSYDLFQDDSSFIALIRDYVVSGIAVIEREDLDFQARHFLDYLHQIGNKAQDSKRTTIFKEIITNIHNFLRKSLEYRLPETTYFSIELLGKYGKNLIEIDYLDTFNEEHYQKCFLILLRTWVQQCEINGRYERDLFFEWHSISMVLVEKGDCKHIHDFAYHLIYCYKVLNNNPHQKRIFKFFQYLKEKNSICYESLKSQIHLRGDPLKDSFDTIDDFVQRNM